MKPILIAVDWGTTSCRAALVGSDGACLDTRSAQTGILAVTDGDFASALSRLVDGWPVLPRILSGMIGSRQGWIEAPYAPCPAGVDDIARRLVRPEDSGSGAIIPGVARDGGWPDVMRGEETQVLGALDALGCDGGLFVLPGTHSKWVRVVGGAIVTFDTYMTGEVFAALRGHTILGRLMSPSAGPFDPAAFRRGVEAGCQPGTPGTLLNRIFSTRTLGLFDRLGPSEAADYLSGLLIGAEIGDAADRADGQTIRIIASETLTDRYLAAASVVGVPAAPAPADAAVRGAYVIATAAGFI